MGHIKESSTGRADHDPSMLSPASRAMLYEFLSYLLTKNPDEVVLAHLTSDEQISKLEDMERAIAEDLRLEELGTSLGKVLTALRSLRDRDEERITRLKDEHVSVLRGIRKGSGPPPPYESVYRSGQMMSDHTSDVQAVYRRAGLEVIGGEPPDHIGLELAFMAFLCRREGECRASGGSDAAEELVSLQDDFLIDHVMTWMPQFCQSVLRGKSDFYRPVVELTMSWLRLEEKRANDTKST